MKRVAYIMILFLLNVGVALGGSVTLAWDTKANDVNCIGVYLYRAKKADLTDAVRVPAWRLAKDVVTYKDDTAIGPMTYYYYATSAYQEPGGGEVESVKSNTVTAIVAAPVMTAPANVRATAVTP